MKSKNILNVTFNESPPPTKLSPLVDDDVGEEEAIENNTKVVNNNNIEDESEEVDEEDGIFFNQSKYIKKMLKKFGLEDSKPTKMPMLTEIKLTKDDKAESVDNTKYRAMIGSLLYLTASRPDIMFSVCLCEIMTQMFHNELQQTIAYSPKLSNENSTPLNMVETLTNLESRGIHEGRSVLPYYYTYNNIKTKLNDMGLYHIYNLDEPICPRFVLEFYSSVNLIRNEDLTFSIQFWFQEIEIVFRLEMFAKLLGIPHSGQCSYSIDSSLVSLRNNREPQGPYHSKIPFVSELNQYLKITHKNITPQVIGDYDDHYYSDSGTSSDED
ncbi:hypothetical protein Tco_0765147 [Tanacetum coccineum]